MFHKCPDKDGIDFILAELKRQNISFDEPIEHIATGHFGLCLIGKDKLVKLHRFLPEHKNAKQDVRHLVQSAKAYARFDRARERITQRGITTPRLLSSGPLYRIIEVGGEKYWSYQILTRVAGKILWPPFVPPHSSSSKLLKPLQKMAVVAAAKFHVSAATEDASSSHMGFSRWFKYMRADSMIKRAATELDRDLHDYMSRKSAKVWVHGDLHLGNIMKDGENNFGIIDLDHLCIGTSAQELSHSNWNPEHLKNIAHQYNLHADVPVSEKILAAFCLGNTLSYYLHAHRMKKPPAGVRVSKHQLLQQHKQRIAGFAEIMYSHTGKKIYLEIAKRFESHARPARPKKSTSVSNKKLMR